jgi:uracil-DNA glycosylase family 4
MIGVPNKFPLIPSSQRIAIIGEAPGKDDVVANEPFCGASGRFLSALLSKAGISRSCCFLGNVCQINPPCGKLELFDWNGYEMQEGMRQLREDLASFKPNVTLLLGAVPLNWAKEAPSKGPVVFSKAVFKLSSWRGYLFDSKLCGKAIATYHPTFTLRDYSVAPLLLFDLKKAKREAGSPTLIVEPRQFQIPTNLQACLTLLDEVNEKRAPVGTDIEGGISSMSCISFTLSRTHAFVVPFLRKDGSHYWTLEEECAIMRKLARVLENPLVPKILQNCLYDTFVLQYSYGICVRGIVDDTMLKAWELYCELEKGLGTLVSIYTNAANYKGDRKAEDDTTFYNYCCMDSCMALEIAKHPWFKTELRPTGMAHYQFNLDMLAPLRYMEMQGMRYDSAKAAERRAALQKKEFEEQAKLNALVGCRLPSWNPNFVLNHAVDLMGMKRNWATSFLSLTVNCKKPYKEQAFRLAQLWENEPFSLASIGEIENLLKVSLNISSPKQCCSYLYDTLKLPTQFSSGPTPHPTADYEALLNLSKYCLNSEQPEKMKVIEHIKVLRALSTRSAMLSIQTDKDGRIRCGYNVVGSETGRITCYSSPTGSGYNLQTIPNYTDPADAPGAILGDRDLFLADEGHWLFQCDLEGADGWTVAAYCKMLGDPTMFDDYKFGLRPAKILALMLRGVSVDFKDRDALAKASVAVKKSDWDYFACKRTQHGANYLEGPRTIASNILTDSEGKLFMEEAECRKMRDAYFMRYLGIQKWHQWVGRQIATRPELTAASGQVRKFFGRPDEILTKAVAHEPQANTTYATNLAMLRLWKDPENRYLDPEGKTRLRVQPLHQVHDAIIGQFRKHETEWAKVKIREWFNNPLQIAGQSIVIPFEGKFGPSWGEQNEGKI